jgi:very-short-patch-repair endonuclease
MHRNVTKIAERQHGLITLGQALECGLTRVQVRERLRAGRWLAIGRGVYRIAGAPCTWQHRLMALTLVAGPNAAASHRAAAALLQIWGFERRIVEVTTPRIQQRRPKYPLGTIVHRWRPFPAHHLTVIEGITTTRVARTLVDLAGVIHPARAERAVDTCLSAKIVTFHTLRGTFYELASRGRAGTACMRKILEDRGPQYIPPASDFEREFFAILKAAGLPTPVRQLDVGDQVDWIGRVDLAYPVFKVIVEVDSDRHHTSKLDREADAERDRRLIAAGWRVVRVTEDDLRRGAPKALAQLRDLLG